MHEKEFGVDDILRLMKTFDESRSGPLRSKDASNGSAEFRSSKVKEATLAPASSRNHAYYEDLSQTLTLVRDVSDLIKTSEEERLRQESQLSEIVRGTREQLGAAETRAREAEAEARVAERRIQELEAGLRAAEIRAQSAELRASEAEDWLDRLRETIAEEFGQYKTNETQNVH